MSRYAALVSYLSTKPREMSEVRLTFAEIEGIIGHPLPPSASQHWYWHGRGYRVHVDLLAEAGWSAHLDPKGKTVGFRRDTGVLSRGPLTTPIRESLEAQAPLAADREERIRDLTENLRRYVEAFTARQRDPSTAVFAGRKVSVHKRTLQRLRAIGLDEVLSGRETEFFRLLYDTLDAWGMNSRAAVLVDFGEFRDSILSNAAAIRELQDISLRDLDETSSPGVARHLLRLMYSLSVSGSRTKMVAFSKALHHMLPNLVPPMDRQYTVRFFLGPTRKTGDIDRHFPDIYRWCAVIAAANREVLPGLVGGCDDLTSNVFDTSETKLIDNAIVEYVKSNWG